MRPYSQDLAEGAPMDPKATPMMWERGIPQWAERSPSGWRDTPGSESYPSVTGATPVQGLPREL